MAASFSTHHAMMKHCAVPWKLVRHREWPALLSCVGWRRVRCLRHAGRRRLSVKLAKARAHAAPAIASNDIFIRLGLAVGVKLEVALFAASRLSAGISAHRGNSANIFRAISAAQHAHAQSHLVMSRASRGRRVGGVSAMLRVLNACFLFVSA